MHSLRARLLLMVLAVLAITAIAAASLFSRLTTHQFESFVASGERDRLDGARAQLGAWHAERGGWDGVVPLLEQIRRTGGRSPMLAIGDSVVIPPGAPMKAVRLVRRDGGVRLEWEESRDGRRLEGVLLFQGGGEIVSGGRTVGEVYFTPGDETERGHRVAFTDALHRSAAIAVAVAAIAALLLAFALSRRILGPVEGLTAAVRRMSHGRLDQRVDVRTRDEIGELAAAFNAMAERLAANERQRRDMVSDVSHELRTPVTHLRAQIEALQDGLAEPDEAALASLHEEVLHLSALIDDLRDLAAADAGQLAIEPAALALDEEFARARSALAPVAEAAGVKLAFASAAGLPAVRADARRLGQILRNLVHNALTHAPAGSEVRIEARETNEALRIEVRDQGPGLDAEQAARVFDRFYRADPSRARATGGSGLGLAIVRQLAEAMGGGAGVDTAPGRGATFWFTLPRA